MKISFIPWMNILNAKLNFNVLSELTREGFRTNVPSLYLQVCIINMSVYRMSQEKCARLREGVPYVKVYRYKPKHLYPKLNGYGDNGQRKLGASCGSKYCNLHS